MDDAIEAATALPRVLVVDDEAAFRNAVARTLRDAGFEVDVAGSGAEALRCASRKRPDLVLLDVLMPECDGYEVCTRLQAEESTAAVPVVFLTGLDEGEDRVRAFACGAVDYVTKPHDDEDLLARIWRHLTTGTRWRRLVPRSGRAHGFDFAGFREFLLGHVQFEPEARRALLSLPAEDLYPFAQAHGIDERGVARLIAEYVGTDYLAEIPAARLVLGALPAQFCRANRIAVLETDHRRSFVVDNPFRYEVVDLLRLHDGDGEAPSLQIAAPATLAALFETPEPPPAAPPRPLEPSAGAPAARPRKVATLRGGDEVFDVGVEAEAPAIRLTNALIAGGVRARASDVHIEPREAAVDLRYRVDGMLIAQDPLPKSMQGPIISRIKIMARLDIAERRVPQDGRARVTFEGRPVDLRVSTLPTRHGEKVVLRILDKSTVTLDLDALGLEPESLAILRRSIELPHGILLVTGPTGSGKTTTLYSALTALDRPNVNIVTVEDPIEYDLAKINQVQVHPTAGLSFPVALRAILRQDPDIIMVGEIRDAETLDIAMKAALTGHLVLSTLHTNDAVSTISRLIDMGSEPFLVASTVEMISAQRLLRKLCASCKEPTGLPEEVAERLAVPIDPGARWFRAVGCEECNHLGYRGRLAVAEVLALDIALRQLVARGADAETLRRHALDAGLSTLRRNALSKAAQGVTSLEEVLRVTV